MSANRPPGRDPRIEPRSEPERAPSATARTTGAVIERLVREHQDAVRVYLSFLGARAEELDDLVQETFLSFLGSTFEERDPAATRAYLRTIARNRLLKEYRRRGNRPPMEDLEHAEVVWREYEADDGGQRFRELLERCLGELRDDARRVLRLRYGEGIARTTIAAELGLSESGVKSILVRALRRLRACVERRGGALPDSAQGALQ